MVQRASLHLGPFPYSEAAVNNGESDLVRFHFGIWGSRHASW